MWCPDNSANQRRQSHGNDRTRVLCDGCLPATTHLSDLRFPQSAGVRTWSISGVHYVEEERAWFCRKEGYFMKYQIIHRQEWCEASFGPGGPYSFGAPPGRALRSGQREKRSAASIRLKSTKSRYSETGQTVGADVGRSREITVPTNAVATRTSNTELAFGDFQSAPSQHRTSRTNERNTELTLRRARDLPPWTPVRSEFTCHFFRGSIVVVKNSYSSIGTRRVKSFCPSWLVAHCDSLC